MSVRDDWHRRPQGPGDSPERSTFRRGRMAADDYTMLANAFLADARLSFTARGVFALLSTFSDSEWEAATPASLAAGTQHSVAEVEAAVSELESHGYLEGAGR
ncbi:hypothetical protein [Streptomyces sp. NPDC049744]|uniref:hypothetical protein n=1 Tax=Streptomyces sp. NPDC049744 TaxID=3154359 RepID=UPI003420BF5B